MDFERCVEAAKIMLFSQKATTAIDIMQNA
jgi:hypothetical protein